MIGSRSRSREIALQVLYSCDTVRAPAPELWASTLDDAEATPEVKAFARELVAGALAQRGAIDKLIATAAENWELSRLATVDRNILRLAVYELSFRTDIPAKVSINEAIELGKRYSTAQSGAFINGILDRVRRDVNRAVDDAPPAPSTERRKAAAGEAAAAAAAAGAAHGATAGAAGSAGAADVAGAAGAANGAGAG